MKKTVPMPPRDGAVMSFEEIAEQLGCTRQNVIQIYTAARRKLRNKLATRGIKLGDLINE